MTRQKLSIEHIISEFNKTHNEEFNKINGFDHYDYSLITEENYNGSAKKIPIICNIHKTIFYITPNCHKCKRGCRICGFERITEQLTFTIEELLEKFKSVHGEKYDYSLIKDYKNNRIKLPIICRIHGTFYQSASSHSDEGNGCNLCRPDNLKVSREEFLNTANKTHNFYYSYDKMVYISNIEKICITCPKHGDFWQIAGNHKRRSGCPRCKISWGERQIMIILDKYKISYEYNKRFKDCRDKNPLPFDFYLPELNICFEYDGPHHFDQVKFIGRTILSEYESYNMLEYFIKHDNIKTEYCIKNNIKLFRIKTKIVKEIEEEIISKLNISQF